MRVAVLSARPTECLRSRHFPPAIDKMLGSHVTNLARTLAGEQDKLERSSGESTLSEGFPERAHLAIGEHALPARGLIALDAVAGIDGDDLLLHRPGEDCRGCRQDLVGEDRGRDPANGE